MGNVAIFGAGVVVGAVVALVGLHYFVKHNAKEIVEEAIKKFEAEEAAKGQPA